MSHEMDGNGKQEMKGFETGAEKNRNSSYTSIENAMTKLNVNNSCAPATFAYSGKAPERLANLAPCATD